MSARWPPASAAAGTKYAAGYTAELDAEAAMAALVAELDRRPGQSPGRVGGWRRGGRGARLRQAGGADLTRRSSPGCAAWPASAGSATAAPSTPPATGVLVMALGRATWLLPFLPTEPKRYLAEVAFGAETDTLDAAGTVTATAAADGVDTERLRAAMAGFPAPRSRSRRWCRRSRWAGTPVRRERPPGRGGRAGPRPIVIHDLSCSGLVHEERPVATISVVCSGGTYVRCWPPTSAGPLARWPTWPASRAARPSAGSPEADAHTLEELAEPGRLEAAVLGPGGGDGPTATRGP